MHTASAQPSPWVQTKRRPRTRAGCDGGSRGNVTGPWGESAWRPPLGETVLSIPRAPSHIFSFTTFLDYREGRWGPCL